MTQIKQTVYGHVQNNIWDHDDEYLTVTVQVEKSNFYSGQPVKVTVEKA